MRVLVAEDEPTLSAQLCAALTDAGYAVDAAFDGRDACYQGQTQAYDAVVLDLGLPELDGLSVLQRWRSQGQTMPVLILTARDQWHEKVAGIDAGADDYLTKPFIMAELQARLEAMLRRSRLPAFGGSLEIPAGASRLRVDALLPRAWLGEEAMELTQREWSLLHLLVANAGQVVSREDVLSAWQSAPADGQGTGSNALEVYVHRLRRKLADSGLSIRNVRGLGYLLETLPT